MAWARIVRLSIALGCGSLAIALGSGCGCDDGLSLTVRLQSGLRAGVEARFADVRLLRGVARCEPGADVFRTFGHVLETREQDALARGTLTLGAFEELQPGLYTVRVRLLRPPTSLTAPADSGPFFMERCVAITLTNDRVVRIPITADCVDVTCPATGGDPAFDQCLNGRCVDPRCDPDDPDAARYCCDRSLLGDVCEDTPTLCEAAGDCSGGPSCALAAECRDGACIEPVDDRCAMGEHCDATDERCVMDAVFVDAGMTDAGTTSADTGLPPMGLVCDRCDEVACTGDTTCVTAGDLGATCLVPCTEDAPDCASGFSCAPVGDARACVPLGACCVDEDGDGYGIGRGCLGDDCDDADAARNGGRVELCNGIDDDCDGTSDDPPTECGGGTCSADGAGFSEMGGDTCSGGSCVPTGMSIACGLFTCEGGGDAGDQCARSCTAIGADDDRFCVASAHCDGGSCAADVASGESCDEDSDCTTGACAMGSCCTPGVGGCMCPGGPTETVCDDGADSDCDMQLDCRDSDCAGRACGGGRTCVGDSCVCPGGSTESSCSNTTDDDCDGQIDCADADCAGQGCGVAGRLCIAGACACSGGSMETTCNDTSDDDCDGLIDCADADCESRLCAAGRVCTAGSCRCAGPPSEVTCGDGLDDDCDGQTDCADADCNGEACGDGRTCSSGACSCAGSRTELNCGDGDDGDCDLLVDCADSDCSGLSCGPFGRACIAGSCACPAGATELCSNGSDDDCDGQSDCSDPDCNGQACASGRTCMSGTCACAGGSTESSCVDGADEDCDGLTDCADPDCTLDTCGSGMQCCGTCQTLPVMYSSYTTTAAMCATTLAGSSYPGLCALHMFYHSDCGAQDMSPYAPGWTHAPSSPAGCDYNGCDGSGNCEMNFCIPCPGGNCTACPDGPAVKPC